MKKRKTHWSCMSFVRGNQKPGCQQRIEAGPDDFKTLRAAGWKPVDTQNSRIFFKCPVCNPIQGPGKPK